MAISDELTRIQTAKADIKASIEAKGVTVPSDALIDTYSDYVDEIQTGGGGGQAEQDLIDLIERKVTSITIPSGTTKIGDYVFFRCQGLTSISIPSTVTTFGRNVFYECTSLTSVTFSNGITVFGDGTFENCINLTSVTLPNNLFSFNNNTF